MCVGSAWSAPYGGRRCRGLVHSKMKLITAIALITFSTACAAQYWKPLGRGPIAATQIQTIYGDSVSQRLLAGGTFTFMKNVEDTVIVMGQAAWNGTRWDSLAHRIQDGGSLPTSGQQQTYWFLRFQDKLYACGGFGFFTDQNEVNRSFARLNEPTQRWEALECLNANSSGLATLVPKEPQNTLYATGYTSTICGYPQSCIFRYDGGSFHIWEPFNEVPPDPLNYVGTVFDYQGYTYVTGSFYDPIGSGYVSFIRHNGTNWEYIPEWGTQNPIKEILIRNGILYVAGAFHISDGAPGNLVASFDGTTWNNMGGGLEYTLPNSAAALDLEWWHDELYVCGLFNNCGGVICDGIAKWTGSQWCALPGQFSGQFSDITTLLDMTIWQDSLYVVGGIWYVDGQPFYKSVAQWIGGDAVANCSDPVGVEENTNALEQPDLVVHPLGNGYQWEVRFPETGMWTLSILDASGRHMRSMQTRNEQVIVDLNEQATGLYLFRAMHESGSVRNAKIVKP